MAATKQESESKPKAKANGKGNGNGKPTPRPTYPDDIKAIADRARGLANPESRQGPVPKQVSDTMRTLKEGPAEAIKAVGLTRAQCKAIAEGKGARADVLKLRPLAERIQANGGARQWTSGRPLAATLVAWLEQS
jgi:hypothetical protein